MPKKTWSLVAVLMVACLGFVEMNVWIFAFEGIADPWEEAMWAFRALGMQLAGLGVLYGGNRDTKQRMLAAALIAPSAFVGFEVILRGVMNMFRPHLSVPEVWSVEGWWWRLNYLVNFGLFVVLIIGLIAGTQFFRRSRTGGAEAQTVKD